MFRDNLKGERLVEYSFVMANIESTGKVLDVGSVGSPLPAMLSGLGFDVVAIDIRNYLKIEKFKNFEFVLGDIRFQPFNDGAFDMVTVVSTLEHVGLKGRYNSLEDSFGDWKAMRELSRCLRIGGKIIVTVPYGRACVCKPFHRIYGGKQIRSMFKDFNLVKDEYLMKDECGHWTQVVEGQTRSVNGSGKRYALGLFVFTKAQV